LSRNIATPSPGWDCTMSGNLADPRSNLSAAMRHSISLCEIEFCRKISSSASPRDRRPQPWRE
jgi:hypothetical protein